MSDLETLIPQAVELVIDGEPLAIKPLKVGQMPAFLRAITPVMQQIGGDGIDWLALFGERGGGSDHGWFDTVQHLIERGHRLPDILDYTLAQVRGFAAATAREDAARDARLLSLIAIGARGDSRHLDQTLDRLQDHAHLGSHR